jgi:hypothetical protein
VFTFQLKEFICNESNFDWFKTTDDGDWFGYWEAFQSSRQQLANFAMFILSVTVQSATCERIFKEHKYIHTATKNQLENETTVAIIAIRANLRASDSKAMKSKNRLLNPTERVRRNPESSFHTLQEGPIVVEDDNDDETLDIVEDSVQLNEVQAALKLFDLIENETEDEDTDLDDLIDDEIDDEIDESQPRITIRLPNPNYRPIDMNPSFWKPVK